MTANIILQMILSLIGGLGIFLLGMKNMSEGMQAIAGGKLRKLISSVTSNRIFACLVGIVITCTINSSSATTVMVVGLVNSGFMTLVQAIGVIMGANIGSTISGWILVLRIGKYGLPMLGIAAFVYLFSRREKVRYIAMAIMGVGMVFFGLQLMSGGFKALRDVPAFLEWISMFRADSYFGVLKCAFIGCVLTMLVQSSFATLGITIGLAEAGMIPFPTAAALVLGENIGTTITALLASIGTTTNARRAAISHTIFNVAGVIWITALFPVYMKLIQMVVGIYPGTQVLVNGQAVFPYIRQGIALTHSGFNIVNTLLFLPFLPMLAKLVCRIIPEKKAKEAPHLTFLDVRMLDTPAIGIEQSREEILRMSDGVQKMLDWLKTVIVEQEQGDWREKKIFHREEILDVAQKEIMEFLSNLLSGRIPLEVSVEARKQLRIADEYESISDYVVTILKLNLKMHEAGLKMSKEGKKEILILHNSVSEYIEMVSSAVKEHNADIISKATAHGDAITSQMKDYRDKHLARVGTESVSPLNSLIFTDMLTAYRKIKDHALNIAEALAG